jgi:aspartate aminotransferase
MTSPVSRNAQRIAPSVTLAISAKAKEMKAQGIDVISLSAGEPDFDTPGFIKEAAIEAIQKGFTKYTPTVGIPKLREAICAKFERDNGLRYDPSQIIVGCGAKHTLFTCILALVGDGDEVIIPTPYWVTYPEQPKIAGGNPVIVETTQAEGYKLTPEALKAAVTPRTKAVILNSPSNPSGVVYSKEELGALADVVLETGIFVISDEIYEKIIYEDAQHHSIASLRDGMLDRTIVVNGVSKTYAMTGWRIGYAAGPKEIISAMGKIQSQETSNPTSISQMAALAALNGPQDCLKEMLVAFDQRRKYIVQRLNAIDGVSCPSPKGAFYVFPDTSSLYGSAYNGRRISGSVDLCNYLLEEVNVACVPGAGFGSDAHIRLSYATSMENIEKAMDRIEKGIGAFRK